MDVAASSSQGPPRWRVGSSRRWLSYFIAALGAGLSPAQEQVLLDYYWIYPESEAQSEQREYGKGYNSLLRTEATELSRMLQREGMEPKRSYAEAWLAVYRRHWLNFDWQPGSSELDEVLFQMMHTDSRHPMTDAEVRHALEVLFAEADFVSLEQGRELLENLADNLRTHSFPLSESGQKSNDELMELFVDALQHNHDSMAAYRDALFKKNGHRLVHHPLVGYRAPWGTGLSARWRYAQAPQQTGITEGTANSSVTSPTVTLTVPLQTPGGATPVLDFTTGMNTTAGNLANFLATAPEEEEKKDDKDEQTDEEEEAPIQTAQQTLAAPAPRMMMMARSRALPSVGAAVTLAAAPELTWSGSTTTTWVNNNAAAQSPWVNSAIFSTGANVTFDDTASNREVTISGTVAPGSIAINADNASGTSGGVISAIIWAEAANATLKYGYAFTGEGIIADASSSAPTSITSTGGSLLVLDTANSFSGGITMKNGALYLACSNAAGSGPITLTNNSGWTQQLNSGTSATSFSQISRTGTELIVNYNSSAADYRNPTIDNPIFIEGSSNGQVRISYGYASYGETKLPNEWRNVSLNGGIYGAGDLYLYGYTTAPDPTHTYVSSFSINARNADAELLNSRQASAYSGTVYLRNFFNSSEVDERRYLSNRLLGGAVQLTLEDDVFAGAVINLTREQTTKTVGWKSSGLAAILTGTSESVAASQTSDNILFLGGNVSLKALNADFRGSGWSHKKSGLFNLFTTTHYDEKMPQADERWRVRVVTGTSSTLTLNDNTASTHVFSGVMGYETSYVQPGQSYVVENDSTTAGGGTLGTRSLSLVKYGQATQYIHSACLNDLSHLQGTLGFNTLEVTGNLNLLGGARLRLGVTDVTDEGGKKWGTISGSGNDTNSTLSLADGKRFLVLTMDGGSQPAPAVVEGSVTMGDASNLVFYVMRDEPGTTAATSLLNVTGTLTLQSNTSISVSFSSVEFAKSAAGKTYYLAAAEGGISVGGKDSSTFQKRFIALGYGYYGTLDTKDSSSADYLVMTVSGDPRRTWSGMVGRNGGSCVWTAAEVDGTDYRWKENHHFMQGQVVLFGNLYQPTAWQEGEWNANSATTTVVGTPLHSGTPVNVTVDALQESDFQKVEIQGEVAPVSVIINSDYWMNGEEKKDGTNYYFCGSGSIRNVEPDEIKLDEFEGSWETDLRKMGSGTAVIATNNSFSGGSVLEGGRVVMQHKNALGTGGITIQNEATLQADFKDDRSTGSWSSAYTGEGMHTATITNPVTAVVYVDPDNAAYDTLVDARISVAHDSKLVLESLSGDRDTVVAFSGNSEASGQYSYSVFKVLDPGKFYGTVKMDGNLRGVSNPATNGGKVQMEIMTTTKASEGGNWLNATIDLSVENGTERTVLALDALGTTSAATTQTAQVAALQGSGAGTERINSSVLNMSPDKAITLQIMGYSNGSYTGVLGFGDFQKTVDYNGASSDIGYEQHHYGRYGAEGTLNVQKDGNSIQSVHSAWINALTLNEGRFIVDEALAVRDIRVNKGQHLTVGRTGRSSAYALTVGAQGILSIDNARAEDAFAHIGAGIPAYTIEVPKEDGQDGQTEEQAVPPAAFVLFENGATITGCGDWYTSSPPGSETLKVNDSDQTLSYTVDIDVATGATVTVNTHNYTPDESISTANDVFSSYGSSHVIQLLGTMTGSHVKLVFNNELISAAAIQSGTAVKRADGLGYTGPTGVEIGHAAIRDIHQFTGEIAVGDMTVLQINQTNADAAAATADMEVTVTGKNGAIQFTDAVTEQYINKVQLVQGGHVLLGGELQNTRTGWGAIDRTQVEVDIANRQPASAGTLDNLELVKTSSSKSINLGGTDADRTDAVNVRITTYDTAENYDTVKLQDMNLVTSLVALHEACSLDVTDAVLLNQDSAIVSSAHEGDVLTGVQQLQVTDRVQSVQALTTSVTAASATAQVSAQTIVELTTSGCGTVYTASNGTQILHVYTNSFQEVNVSGKGLTLHLADDLYSFAHAMGMEFVSIQVGGDVGQFLLESDNATAVADGQLGDGVNFVLTDSAGHNLSEDWVSSSMVSNVVGSKVSMHMLWVRVPEPATTTLSLLALSALCARRRRK